MKRSLSAIVVGLALLMPPSASAAGKKYRGEVEGGGTVSFQVVKRDNGRKVVKRFRWNNIIVECPDGEHTYDAVMYPMKVFRGGFGTIAVTPDRRTRAVIKGEVHRRKANGWLNVEGRIPHDDGVDDGCGTLIFRPNRRVKWDAERVQPG
jgi:hypothetical protein